LQIRLDGCRLVLHIGISLSVTFLFLGHHWCDIRLPTKPISGPFLLAQIRRPVSRPSLYPYLILLFLFQAFWAAASASGFKLDVAVSRPLAVVLSKGSELQKEHVSLYCDFFFATFRLPFLLCPPGASDLEDLSC